DCQRPRYVGGRYVPRSSRTGAAGRGAAAERGRAGGGVVNEIDRRRLARPTADIASRLKNISSRGAGRTAGEDADLGTAKPSKPGRADYLSVKAALQERLLDEIGERGLLESDGADVAAAVKDFAARAIASEDIPLNETERVRLAEELTDETIGMGPLAPLLADPAVSDILVIAVRARKNILISGGTGAGKSTLLGVLAEAIPDHERIVTIEDTAELSLDQEHVVRMETRPINIEGRGRIVARDLLINALRMRPDRIIVGEVRGGEALDMLQALNTGHDGGIGTI